jgi:hypothetical protein
MRIGSFARLAIALSLPSVSGCGGDDDPADIAGEYTVNVTNGASTCPLQNWDEGGVATNIPLTITQHGATAEAELGGITAVYVDVILGEGVWEGSVEGSGFTLVREGTRPLSSGACAFTIRATASATLTGDAIQGTIRYVTNTNDSPDCVGVAGCSATQSFNGVRPPR